MLLLSDNAASVEAINNMRAKSPVLMSLVRELFYICAIHSFQVKAKHVAGKLNPLADCLSRPSIRQQAWSLRPCIRQQAWSLRPSLTRVPIQPILPSMDW